MLEDGQAGGRKPGAEAVDEPERDARAGLDGFKGGHETGDAEEQGAGQQQVQDDAQGEVHVLTFVGPAAFGADGFPAHGLAAGEAAHGFGGGIAAGQGRWAGLVVPVHAAEQAGFAVGDDRFAGRGFVTNLVDALALFPEPAGAERIPVDLDRSAPALRQVVADALAVQAVDQNPDHHRQPDESQENRKSRMAAHGFILRQGSGDPTPCGGYPGPPCWALYSFTSSILL